MASEDIKEFRRQRFEALLNHPDFGGRQVELGRALGWKDGAYVWQIVNGHRPVKEDLVQKIETIRGGRFAGWFSATPQQRESIRMPRITEWPFGAHITPEEWAQIPDFDRGALVAELRARVRELAASSAAASGKRQVQ